MQKTVCKYGKQYLDDLSSYTVPWSHDRGVVNGSDNMADVLHPDFIHATQFHNRTYFLNSEEVSLKPNVVHTR